VMLGSGKDIRPVKTRSANPQRFSLGQVDKEEDLG